MKQQKRKAAFVPFGEVNSPKALLDEMSRTALGEIRSIGLDLVAVDTVTDDAAGVDVKRALAQLETEKFDLLIVCVAGWIPSHAVIAITDAYRNTPMILWGLAGSRENGRIVTTAAQAGTTALRKVFSDLGYKFTYLYNVIGKPSPLKAIGDFARAAFALSDMRCTTVGMMGFQDMKLHNTLYEGASLKSGIGTDIRFFEMLEMQQLSAGFGDAEITPVLDTIKKDWDFTKPVSEDFLRKGVSYYLAIKKIAEENGYDAISLKDVDGMKKILNFPPAMIFMLLADRMEVCTIPENDTMGSVTQLIIKKVTGQCAAYLEFYEFFDTSVLMGVPDYVPAEIVEGRVRITAAAFGQISGGLLNISTLKTGTITLARLSNTGSRYTMHLAVGTGKPVAWEEAGWDQPAPRLPSLEIELGAPVGSFADHISGQHYIIAYGDHSRALMDFCYLANIDVIL